MARSSPDSNLVYRAWVEFEGLNGNLYKYFWGPYQKKAQASSMRNSQSKQRRVQIISSGVQEGTVIWKDC